MAKLISAQQAAELVKNGQTVTVCGMAGLMVPEKICRAIAERFKRNGEPRDLTLYYPVMFGFGEDTGLEHFAHEGMVRRFIGSSYYNQVYPRLTDLVNNNKVEAYNFILGGMFHILRCTAMGLPGYLTQVGLNTFQDPRQEGGKFNSRTKEDLVELHKVNGQEYLLYKSVPIDVAVIRGTTADEDGNITLDEEYLSMGVRVQAMAAKTNGGIVIAQVKRMARPEALHPRGVEVPGALVDYIVIDPDQPVILEGARRLDSSMFPPVEDYAYNPAFSGEARLPLPEVKPIDFNQEKVIGRRAAMEVRPGEVTNLGGGIGIRAVPLVAIEEGVEKEAQFSIEHGSLGGVNIGGVAHHNVQAILPSADLMDFYVGGGLGLAILSFGELDADGNVNVSKFGPVMPGCGGFIDISHRTPRIVFVGAMTTGGLQVELSGGSLRIVKEGKRKKLLNHVGQITFNGRSALKKGQDVIYVTERAVFKLREEGVVLTEIAPGVDLKKDILDQSEFQVKVSPDLTEMDKRIFRPEPMGLKLTTNKA